MRPLVLQDGLVLDGGGADLFLGSFHTAADIDDALQAIERTLSEEI